MQISTTIKLLLSISIKYPIYFLSGIFIRNKNRWIFGSYYGFNDNAKYLYLDVISNHPSIDAVYFLYNIDEYTRLKKLGLNVCHGYSLKSLYYLLTSKVYIGTHGIGLGLGIPKTLARNANYIELWHGIPMKRIDFLDKFSKYTVIQGRIKKAIHKFLFFFTPRYIRRDLVVMSSAFVSNLLQRSFNLSERYFINAYNPRCQVFFWEYDKLLGFINKYETKEIKHLHKTLNGYKETFLYMPTFRDNNPDFLLDAKFDFAKLNQLMIQRNAVFLIKLHPQTATNIQDEIKLYPNLKLLPTKIDIYTFLPKTNVLITDYSSVYIDFMLNHKGNTIFFPFDYDDYISHSRELSYAYDDNISGIRVDTFAEFLATINNDAFINFAQSKKQSLLSKFWGNDLEKQDLIGAIKKLANKKH